MEIQVEISSPAVAPHRSHLSSGHREIVDEGRLHADVGEEVALTKLRPDGSVTVLVQTAPPVLGPCSSGPASSEMSLAVIIVTSCDKTATRENNSLANVHFYMQLVILVMTC
jgi:hypothetical protein